MSEDKAREELNRASRAKVIYEDPIFAEAVEALKARLWDEFATSEINDDDTRRNARIGLDMLDRILKSFKHHMETGKFAALELASLEKK